MEERKEFRVIENWKNLNDYVYSCVFPHIPNFAKRYIGQQLLERSLLCGTCLCKANKLYDPMKRRQLIDQADTENECLRQLIQTCYRLRYVDNSKKEQTVRLCAELGRSLGAWLKSYSRQAC